MLNTYIHIYIYIHIYTYIYIYKGFLLVHKINLFLHITKLSIRFKIMKDTISENIIIKTKIIS